MKKTGFMAVVLVLALAVGTSFALFNGDAEETKTADDSAAQLSPRVAEEVRQAESTSPQEQQYARKCGGGCCDGGGTEGTTASADQAKQIEAYLVDYFTRSMGEGISVDVKDLGCHHEADVLQAGKVIKRLSINGGQITEIG